jgi:hypothetical protein
LGALGAFFFACLFGMVFFMPRKKRRAPKRARSYDQKVPCVILVCISIFKDKKDSMAEW